MAILTGLPTAVRGVLLTLPFAVHLLAADVALSLLLPVSFLLPTAVYEASSRLAGSVWAHIQALFTGANGAEILASASWEEVEEEDDGSGMTTTTTTTTARTLTATITGGAAATGETPLLLPAGESAIVVSNHRAWADFYLIQALAGPAGMLSRCRWIAKRELRLVPLLGWGLWAMGMPLVSRAWTTDRAELERVFRGPVHRAWPVWLVAFSEATRYTERKHEAGLRWCERQGRPAIPHVLYPRFRGFVATVGQLRRARHVTAVYDVTVAYAKRVDGGPAKPGPKPAPNPGSDANDGSSHSEWRFMVPPNIWETLSRADLADAYRFWVHVRRFDLARLPADEPALERWLEARWVEKGDMLERLRRRIEAGESTESLRLGVP